MNLSSDPEALRLKEELEKLLKTLKTNRDKVPLNVLKTKYKKGYSELCRNISTTASDYAKHISLYGIRIHKDYMDEGLPIINQTIHESGILKELSRAAFHKQDITEFTNLAFKLRDNILEALEPFYGKHTSLYITPECLENPDTLPEFYCFVYGCIWHDGLWLPFEQVHPHTAQPQSDKQKLSQTA